MAITRKGNREIASSIKKKNISDTAISMFRYKGFENTTIADISKATGMSTGSIYNFFGSKEGIISAAIREPAGYIIYKTDQWDNRINSPKDTILQLLMRYASFFESLGPELVRNISGAIISVYNEPDGRFTDTDSVVSLRAFISECQERGTVNKKRSADEYTQILLSVLESTILLWTRFGFDLKDKLSYNLDIVFSDMF